MSKDGLTVKNKKEIESTLSSCFEIAADSKKTINVAPNIALVAENFFSKIGKNMTGFTNLITCLACGATDVRVDVRYHRKSNTSQSESMPAPPAGKIWFSGRGISESVIYPWMEFRNLRTSKSGWQTRTFERPKAYTLNYPENIGYLRDEFLKLLDFVSRKEVASKDLLSYLFRLEIKHRLTISALRDEIGKKESFISTVDLGDFFHKLFSLEKSSRLPVLAVYALYQCITAEYDIYLNCELLPIGDHEAADSRTNACGDIELAGEDGTIFEAIEVKHGIRYDLSWLLRIREKIEKHRPAKYLALTTHDDVVKFDSEAELCYGQIIDDNCCDLLFENTTHFILSHFRTLQNQNNYFGNLEQLLRTDKAVTERHLEFYKSYKFEYLRGTK